MSKRIAKLLDEPVHLVAKHINELETKNGYPSHDVRLLAENIQKIRTKISDLGLDPDDTTGEELYHALLTRFDRDSLAFDSHHKFEGLGFDEKNTKAMTILNSVVEMPQQWTIKNGAIKKLLRRQPPKRVMKHLHYRSAESMLKHEDLEEIMLASSQIESAAWQKSFDRLVTTLDQANIEIRPVKLQHLSFKRWAEFSGPANFVIHDNNSASIGLWPSTTLIKAPLLTIVLMLLEELDKYEQHNNSHYLSKVGEAVSWWLDMDHLLADMDDGPVSLSLKDSADNLLQKNSYQERKVSYARNAFWKELVSRYENLPAGDVLFEDSLRAKIGKFKFAAPEMSLEFVEDI